MLNTGYNKQTVRTNVTQQFNNAISASHQPDATRTRHDRRGITVNDNNGISADDVF